MFASLAAFTLSVLLARLGWTGALYDENFHCGTFGLSCLFDAVAIVLVGCTIGSALALGALVATGVRSWLNWLALSLNAGTLLAVLGMFLLP